MTLLDIFLRIHQASVRVSLCLAWSWGEYLSWHDERGMGGVLAVGPCVLSAGWRSNAEVPA